MRSPGIDARTAVLAAYHGGFAAGHLLLGSLMNKSWARAAQSGGGLVGDRQR